MKKKSLLVRQRKRSLWRESQKKGEDSKEQKTRREKGLEKMKEGEKEKERQVNRKRQ